MKKGTKKMKKGFVICTVRGASDEYKNKLEEFVAKKEAEGWKMHLPHRDTNQEATGVEICSENFDAIFTSDRVFIFYNPDSQGTHFDMGMTFALVNLIAGRHINYIEKNKVYKKKPIDIEVVENIEFGEGKSYARMLTEWENMMK